jgi:hypothetical protein
MNNKFQIISNRHPEYGRCVFCDGREFCGRGSNSLICECNIDQHYININRLRKIKLNRLKKIYESR